MVVQTLYHSDDSNVILWFNRNLVVLRRDELAVFVCTDLTGYRCCMQTSKNNYFNDFAELTNIVYICSSNYLPDVSNTI